LYIIDGVVDRVNLISNKVCVYDLEYLGNPRVCYSVALSIVSLLRGVSFMDHESQLVR